MARLKFGFHTGPTGVGVDKDFYQDLDNAGISFFAKGADNFPFDAQAIAKSSATKHFIVYRTSLTKNLPPPSGNPDVPDYTKPPKQAALEHWAWHKSQLPPELDKNLVWLETINEVDKNKAEWLGEFAYETALLTLAEGYKWLAFGWAAGEPEPQHWNGPQMQKFLNLASQYPDRLGVALHEYSFDVNNIENQLGSLIGRFEILAKNWPNVSIFITEWGWTLWDAPAPEIAMLDYLKIGALYAKYPQVKGAATWYLGGGWQDIKLKIKQLIQPLKQLTLETEFTTTPPPPVLNYKSIPVLLPQDTTLEERTQVLTAEFNNRRTITQSLDEAVALVTLAKPESYVIIYDLHRWSLPEQQILLGLNHELRNLTLPGRLTLPILYSQRDSKWAATCIGVCNGHDKTIGNWGCLLVAYNMMAAYMGLTTLNPLEFNNFAVRRGVFQGPYLLPAALKTMYPSDIVYDGYLSRGDALDAKIKIWIDNKIPVPARVDFNPNTGQWEQHWVLIVGYTNDDFIIADPWHGDETLLSARYNISGNDVLEGIFYLPKLTETVDMLGFMRADPYAFRVVRHSSGQGEDFQDYRYPLGPEWAMVKGNNAEFWKFDNEFIYLFEDTSPSPANDGTERFYRVTPGKWCKRFQAVGETFNDGGHYVQFYNKKTCQPHPQNSGNSQNNTTVLNLEKNYTFNKYGQNITLDEVLFVQGNMETQVFARHNGKALGRVAWYSPWGESEIVELHWDRGVASAPQEFC